MPFVPTGHTFRNDRFSFAMFDYRRVCMHTCGISLISGMSGLGFFDGIRHKSPSPHTFWAGIRAPTNAKNSIRSLRLWTFEKKQTSHGYTWWNWHPKPTPKRQNATDLPNWGDLKHFFHGDAKTLELDPWPKRFVSRKDLLNQVQGKWTPTISKVDSFSIALGKQKPSGIITALGGTQVLTGGSWWTIKLLVLWQPCRWSSCWTQLHPRVY